MLAALRQNARPLCNALGVRSVTHASKVVDSMVAVTAFVDGIQVPVMSTNGTPLNKALAAHPDSASACVQLSPVEGLDCPVDIPPEFISVVAPANMDDIDFIKSEVAAHPDSITDSTRLASKVILTPDMNGMYIAVHPVKSQTVL
uniref:Uncharacterized protein n=1 Tax=Pyramimonas obovata TaxID=1411642 RepID=A0A7S0R1T4_9CHLO|mmetsp:Transcript_2374/g.4832  ORF Transcript_2374/g.4832 Transcript_2374/m.4832 type:complete len:145 (+) Transcript_2374:99-533(+)|eukprot:CAMPEP_0118931924 /NCGR_PEP_ID=MMETSP1169-20130426/8699_1 /TAXON_ID=36882 /ORGANISM="Pyramimonas obovata, Strain CCMP722" /LENGTH=144 /DNA_ID=CAMNT_0006874501 /DNA_START=95 /DNA_END=529 /DNA_ORIENTATION=+